MGLGAFCDNPHIIYTGLYGQWHGAFRQLSCKVVLVSKGGDIFE
jgi:hypothetical protein